MTTGRINQVAISPLVGQNEVFSLFELEIEVRYSKLMQMMKSGCEGE